MNDTILLTEQQDGVTVITLNRPEVMNSFNFALLRALKAKINEIRFDAMSGWSSSPAPVIGHFAPART
jgi:enoyl-CoA hydratase/carnithine racemase